MEPTYLKINDRDSVLQQVAPSIKNLSNLIIKNEMIRDSVSKQNGIR